MLLEALTLFLVLVGLALLHIKWRSETYWQSKGVKVPSHSFPLGNHAQLNGDLILRRKNANTFATEQYKEMADVPYYGVYLLGKPNLVIKDPKLMKEMLVKDFHLMPDRLATKARALFGGHEIDDLWTEQITMASAENWKDLRSTFTPIFTSGKMKAMVPFIDEIRNKLKTAIGHKIDNGEEIELREMLGKFSMDTIASCAFGVDAHSFEKQETNFVKNASSVFRRSASEGLKFFLALMPGGKLIMKYLNMSVFKIKETLYFYDVVKSTVTHRNKTGQRRNDLIDMMIEAMKNNLKNTEEQEVEDQYDKDAILNHHGKKEFNEKTLVATAMIMLIAGYDTTGQTMAYMSFELARNTKVQKRLQEEIDDVMEQNGGELPNYYSIQSMEYLDMVFQETLRKYPPLGFLQRVPLQDYKIPGTDLVIEADNDIFFNVVGMHQDPVHFPEPHVFNPERFSKEGRTKWDPYAFAPFGHGPRNCIARRFAMLEAKMGIVMILSNFNLVTSERTIKGQVEFDPKADLGAPKDGLWVRGVKRL